ncbi:MAG TPA: molybdate ABC transporter substrate-binding protein [Burkholderiales bacterium]|nr:molybdate ABC transporter substrate-binding protein [Burkholderiales bacterium]
MRLFRFAALLAALLFVPAALPAAAADTGTITVFAAASLTDALTDIGKAYEAKSGTHVVFSFAASSVLARQIENSAGADMFMSADLDWMDYLDRKNLIAPGTRRTLLGNHLVLIAPAGLKMAVKIAPHFDLAGALGNSRLALADPASVPAGKYAKAALTSLGVWDGVSGKLAVAENVRAALAYVARGETTLGIVYNTDAKIEPRVHVVGIFPDSSHAPILYPVALTRDAKPGAAGFETFLQSPAARAVFEKYGFTVP